MHLLDLLRHSSRDLSQILVSHLIAFVLVCSRIKNNILAIYPSDQPHDVPPLVLPHEAKVFLQRACRLKDPRDVDICWKKLGTVIWNEDEVLRSVNGDEAMQRTFESSGGCLFPSFRSIWPKTSVCLNQDCSYVQNQKNLKLQGVEERHGILYTLSGPVAVLVHHITCHGCGVVYHLNYYVVTDQSTDKKYRHYYSQKSLPDIIQVGDHQFVDTRVALNWRYSMVSAWVSATNCASIYTQSTDSRTFNPPAGWKFNTRLQNEHIYDSFKIISLLDYHDVHSSQLVILHDGAQSKRFDEAMREVNSEVRQYGQTELNHRCRKCVREFKQDGVTQEVFAVVCDGVTVGRPTCGVPHCDRDLNSPRESFCPDHQTQKDTCRIVGCAEPICSPGSKTCINQEHQEIERQYRAAASAAFQLKARYERTHEDHRARGAESDAATEELDTGMEVVFEGTTSAGTKKKVRAQFGRTRTHNEQLIIAPCGMILSRATFHYSEGPSQVAEFTFNTFNGRRVPEHFIYDTNCILSQYVRGVNVPPHIRDFFAHIKLAVDVFHFKCKHKESDQYCQLHCNPYAFPELMYRNEKGDEKWYFNTSVAEQTNTWFGRYQSMCREMGGVFYEFFLNEMIRLRNQETKEKLEEQELNPSHWNSNM
ncbi:hypothetical protein AAF712_011415 [Marasmius tenuissimus]|uniref:CxC5 like cysteine cluster associated with KDZ domain-containing protein n=1 Tax=Marasmius tenuissimus TaxID=585030 RepID=A0ABR2ZJC6_9AGAR